MRPSLLLTACALLAGAADNPITWTLEGVSPKPGASSTLKLASKVEPGWYLYGLSQPDGGPRPTRIWLPEGQPFKLKGEVKAPQPERKFDSSFDMQVEKFKGSPEFRIPIESSGPGTLRVSVQYQACNDTLCLPPKTVTLEK